MPGDPDGQVPAEGTTAAAAKEDAGVKGAVESAAAEAKGEQDAEDKKPSAKSEPAAEDEDGGRIIRGSEISAENDNIQFKWNATFHNFTPEEKAQLALDEVSMYSITDTRSAHNTSKIIQQLVGDRATVTDGCAAAGGNTFAFARHFAKVHAVELNAQRFGLLNHNLKVLGLDRKVTTYNQDFLELIGTLKQDVVFLDPPWGGMAYTEKDKVTLTFGGLSLVELCERLKPHTRIIALKLPLNYDLDNLAGGVTSSIIRADDRCARKQLFVVMDTSGREPRHTYKRHRDVGGLPEMCIAWFND